MVLVFRPQKSLVVIWFWRRGMAQMHGQAEIGLIIGFIDLIPKGPQRQRGRSQLFIMTYPLTYSKQ
jgi:hypothetical protein